ncbi:hypothetical protein RvY_12511 [Ramazzottius varieornatus]|uniref:Uncharacterized protein n=1 Tax=Ramazzottius varieornatus TaxID=947166 RepID=A0A1D1VLQ3_RAMVA|nr:hypothetical protein RvY_12511 [Ramazzottius varieornatus]
MYALDPEGWEITSGLVDAAVYPVNTLRTRSASKDLQKQILQLDGILYRSLNSLPELYPTAQQQPAESDTRCKGEGCNFSQIRGRVYQSPIDLGVTIADRL